MLSTCDQYVRSNQHRLLDELKDFLRIPSISTLPEHRPDIARAAQFVADQLLGAGMENVEVIPTAGHPLVYGESLHAPGKPTVLCYGHYDVQPADPLELWESPPFEPTIRNGNIYARGSADDKGQFFAHIKAVEVLRACVGALPVNVKFLIEGEEEVGGESIRAYVAANPEKLKADVALVSDSNLYADGLPTLCTGLRGLIYMELEAAGPARDLHSGLYGGAAPNPVFALVEFLARCKDAQGRILIPGIYDDVQPPAPEELASWRTLPFDEKEFLAAEVGSSRLTGEPDFSVLERIWARPTFEVHGISGGFTGQGQKTVIPAKAAAKLSMRAVPAQDPQKLVDAFRRFVEQNTPPGICFNLRVLSASPAISVNPHHPAIETAARVFAEVLGRPTVFIRDGASIPVVGDFAEYLHIPTVLMGFGLPDDGLHSPNEKYRVENYFMSIVTVARFFEEYGA